MKSYLCEGDEIFKQEDFIIKSSQMFALQSYEVEGGTSGSAIPTVRDFQKAKEPRTENIHNEQPLNEFLRLSTVEPK